MILGQDKLLNKINKLTLDTLPHSIILLGEEGSGKNTICDYISNRFNTLLIDITDNLTQEYLEELYQKTEPFIYKIRAKDITVKQENVILKFIEEPLKNSYIIICCDNKSQLIPTVMNRCQVWQLAVYDKETLNQFLTNKDNESILSIVNTPGKVKKLESYDVNKMLELTNKIYDKVKTTTFSNVLNISNKINFKDEVEKYDYDLFVDVLLYTIKNKILTNNDTYLVSCYKLTDKLRNDSLIAHTNKKHLFENFLLNLKVV